MKKALSPKLHQLRKIQPDEEESSIPRDLMINLSDVEYKQTVNLGTAMEYLENNIYTEKEQGYSYRFLTQSLMRKKYVGEPLYGIITLENTSNKSLLNLNISLAYDQFKSSKNKKEVFFLKKFDVQKMKPKTTLIIPFYIYLEEAAYQLNLRVYYYESWGDNMSELLKFHWPVPIQPVKALNINQNVTSNLYELESEYFFEVNINNISEKYLQLEELEIKLNKGVSDSIQFKYILPHQKNISLNFGESFCAVLCFSKKSQPLDCNKQITFGYVTVKFNFLDKTNDGGFIDLILQKNPDEKKFLKILPGDQNFLKFRQKKISVFHGRVLNLSQRTLYLKFEKISNSQLPISLHKILVEGKERLQGIYSLNSNDFLNIFFVIFPRMKGFHKIDFFKVYYMENSIRKLIEYDSPFLQIF